VGQDIDLNLLNLRPDPVHFVRFIKSIDRIDLSPKLFVKLLEAYSKSKSMQGDPRRYILVHPERLATNFFHKDALISATRYTDADATFRDQHFIKYSQ
jgi:hypothetical protein